MAKTIYYITCDNGDGSSGVAFFDSKHNAEVSIEEDPETFGNNDYVGEIEVTDEQYQNMEFN